MFKLPQNALISHASKVMLKILQARFQQYVICEIPDVQAGFRKARDTALLTKIYIVEAVFFSCSHVRMWKLDHKEG